VEEWFAHTTSNGNLHGLLFVSCKVVTNRNELIQDTVKITNANST